MAYTHTLFSELRTLLGLMLGDVSGVFHTIPEQTNALSETLRVWNLLTMSQTGRGTIAATPGDAFYDLSVSLPSLRPRSLRDRSLISEMEYALMEPQNFAGWTGTDQYSLSELVRALQNRRDRFLAETACTVEEHTEAVAAGNSGYVDLDDTIIAVRRAVYVTSSGRYYLLHPSDERTATGLLPNWAEDGAPRAYAISTVQPLRLQIIPPPMESGELKLLVTKTGAAVSPDANGSTGVLLGVPDDLAWGVKYGALADLYPDNRSEACENMFKLAVQMAKSLPVILHADINNLPTIPGSLSVLDSIHGAWEGHGRGTPKHIAVAGLDFIALSPVPRTADSINLQVVKRTVIPLDAEFVQVGREHLDPILGYARHLALLKVGGPEFAETTSQAQKFFDAADQVSARQSIVSTLLTGMRQTSTSDLLHRPNERTEATKRDPDEVRSERNARRRSTTAK